MNDTPTPQAVQNAEPPIPAGFHARVMASMVDLMILLFVILQLTFLINPLAMWWYALLAVPVDAIPSHDELNLAAQQGKALQLLLDHGFARKVAADSLFSFLLYSAYALPFMLWKGWTPGKWLFGLRVVRSADLQPPSRGQLVLRHVAYLVSLLPVGAGFVWVGLNPGKRGLHDYVARTRVIAIRRFKWASRYSPPTPRKVLDFYKSILWPDEKDGDKPS